MSHAHQVIDSYRTDRAEAVAATIAGIREATQGCDEPDRSAAVRIGERLLELAQRRELWSADLFPISPDRLWAVYLLSEDDDGGFALYMSAARAGHAQPPHNHTTWAAIAGIDGVEANRLYERLDPAIVPGPARLKPLGRKALGPGDVLFLGPDEIHSIEVTEGAPALHLHVYGRAFRLLDRRVRFDPQSRTCDYFPIFTDVPRLY